MFDAAAALALLQYGDSAYPAGGFAFSWGVEGLAADGFLDGREGLEGLVRDHLCFRWATMDRVLLCRAYLAPDLEAVAAVDRYAEAATPSAQMRDGSHRAGKALLGIAVRLAARSRPGIGPSFLQTPALATCPSSRRWPIAMPGSISPRHSCSRAGHW